jgi:tryptophan-rich sensory protein
MTYRIILFLIINFAALAIGGLSTTKAVTGDWYLHLNKAPWTPPGWVFGAAWTTIMICFSFYMAYAWEKVENHNVLLTLFIIQWILNVAWNPVFFTWHYTLLGLIVITLLSLLILYFLFHYMPELRLKSILILPYVIWLMIATSLNAYVYLKN